jgi:hypothetical protein
MIVKGTDCHSANFGHGLHRDICTKSCAVLFVIKGNSPSAAQQKAQVELHGLLVADEGDCFA